MKKQYISKVSPKKLIFPITIFSIAFIFSQKKFEAEEAEEFKAGIYQKELPTYSYEEIKKHNSKENKIWVTFGNGVYVFFKI